MVSVFVTVCNIFNSHTSSGVLMSVFLQHNHKGKVMKLSFIKCPLIKLSTLVVALACPLIALSAEPAPLDDKAPLVYINQNIGFNVKGYKYKQSEFPCDID